jgi:hypothetical protein
VIESTKANQNAMNSESPSPAAIPPHASPTPREARLTDAGAEILSERPSEITYQHSVLCQTCLPYRDPGLHVREWHRTNGRVALRLEAGSAWNSELQEWVDLALPYGPTPRIVLMYLNGEALRTGSPEIDVEPSMSAFVGRLGMDKSGRNIRRVKDQLGRLCAATIRLAPQFEEGRQVDAKITTEYDLWFPKDERQRVLWPSYVRLSADYFANLTHHAVPLDPRAVGALKHSAMALDIYTWLAQRLHRIDPARPSFIAWPALQDQFGQAYGRLRDFRRILNRTLDQVVTVYPAARLESDRRGLTLYNSAPPVLKRLVSVRRP